MSVLSTPVAIQAGLAGICIAGALWWVIEGVRLFLRYRRVVAEVTDRTYSDAQQQLDRRAHPWDRLRNLDPHSLKATIPDLLRVRYSVDGKSYEQGIRTARLRGQPSSPTRVVWYDPDDPTQILRNGPGSSFWCAAGALILAGIILDVL